MTVRNLDALFAPGAVAVIGASTRPQSVGATVMRNLLQAGFRGPIMPVNPKHRAVEGVLAYPDVASLPVVPDLAVVCTPPRTVPNLIAELGARGTRAALVLTAGLAGTHGDDGRDLQQAALQAARPHLLRVLGPNCVGLLVPGARLNASFAHTAALPGSLAFVSQSGALCTTILDQARSNGIGFSAFVSLGNGADVDFGDLLDWLGSDPGTSAILLYVESIRDARKFMSAGRAAARNKPVLVVKAGRVPEGARAASSHTGALAGSDDVYDAAIRRAGMLRVAALQDLFAAVETLGRTLPPPGERLAILTNGGGPGVLATDALVAAGGALASLAPATMARLDAALPGTWSRGNPVDIIGDAPAERWVAALAALLDDEQSDAVLLLCCPTAIVPSADVAHAVVATARERVAVGSRKTLLTCWLGGESLREAREICAAANLPAFTTPEAAIAAFLQVVDWRRNQELLLETPAAATKDDALEACEPDLERAREVVRTALAAGRELLDEVEAKQVLAAFAVPVVPTQVVRTAAEAAAAAATIGFPVALKVLSPQVSHKSDVGGVALDLASAADVERAAAAMTERLSRLAPHAELAGYTVQPMVRRAHAHELIAGAATDPTFGPVVLFGHGGTAVEVVADRAVALPPLNARLARALIDRTRVARLLRGYRDRPAADLDAIAFVLVQIGQLVAALPEVVELDVNPLLADAQGVVALDARIRVAPPPPDGGRRRLAIRPYPRALEERVTLADRELLLRPIRPDDAARHREFFESLAPADSRFRFFGAVRQLPLSQLARSTQIDYEREMTFLAVPADADGPTLGLVTAGSDPDDARADFAIAVRAAFQGRGLGRVLLEKMIRYLRQRGTGVLVGQAAADNQPMLALARELGFEVVPSPTPDVVEVRLEL